jgi:hypothetical protein
VLNECIKLKTILNPRTEFSEWFLRNLDTMFMDIIVSSDEATFKLDGTVNNPTMQCDTSDPHNHVGEVLNFPGFPVSCDVIHWCCKITLL